MITKPLGKSVLSVWIFGLLLIPIPGGQSPAPAARQNGDDTALFEAALEADDIESRLAAVAEMSDSLLLAEIAVFHKLGHPLDIIRRAAADRLAAIHRDEIRSIRRMHILLTDRYRGGEENDLSGLHYSWELTAWLMDFLKPAGITVCRPAEEAEAVLEVWIEGSEYDQIAYEEGSLPGTSIEGFLILEAGSRLLFASPLRWSGVKEESPFFSNLLAGVSSSLLPLFRESWGMTPWLELLRHDFRFPSLRPLAAECLGEMKGREATDALRAGLEDEDKAVRLDSALALGRLGDRRSFEPLVAALETAEDPSELRSVIQALGGLRDSRAVEPLLSALKKEDWRRFDRNAAEALDLLLGPKAEDIFLTVLREGPRFSRRDAVWALGKYRHSRALHALATALRSDEDFLIRRSAAEALGKLKDRTAAKPLLSAVLGDEHYEVRPAALQALIMLKAPGLIEELLKALGAEEAETRARACAALGRLGDPGAVEPLIAALEDGSPDVRWQATWALGSLGDPRAVEPILTGLEDDDPSVVESSVWALSMIKDPKAVDPLLALLEAEEPPVKPDAVVRALAEFDAPRAIPSLLKALKGEDFPFLRCEAALAVGRYDDPRVVDSLLESLKNDEDENVRWSAAMALNKIKEDRVLEGLAQALLDANADVRQAAMESLLRLGRPCRVLSLIEALPDGPLEVFAGFSLLRLSCPE